jgi:hypothetical protein
MAPQLPSHFEKKKKKSTTKTVKLSNVLKGNKQVKRDQN